jgi:hypothetical protein
MIETENIITSEGEEIIRIDGLLTELQVARTKVNLLEQLQNGSSKKAFAKGVIAAASDMHSVVATSAALALYDGEDMFNFAAIIDGRVVCGVLADADKLKSGDAVTAVVSKRGEVLFVHSLKRVRDDLLLLPLSAVCGAEAFFKECMRTAWRVTRLQWVFISTIFIGYELIETPEHSNYLFLILFTLLGPPLMMFPMEYWSYRTMAPTGNYAECIFKVYGFPNPEYFDASAGVAWFAGEDGGFHAMNAARAIEVHQQRYNMWA